MSRTSEYRLLVDKPPSVVVPRSKVSEHQTRALTSTVESGPTTHISLHELVYKEQVVDNKSEYDFRWYDFLLGLLFIGLFVLDVGTDIYIAVLHFTNRDVMYGVVTVVPVLLAYLTVFGFALVDYGLWEVELSKYFPFVSRYQEKVARRIWVFRIVCLILGLAPIIRTIEFLMCGCKSWEPTEKEEMKKYIKQIVDKGLADSCDDRSKSRKPTEEKERKKYIKQIVDKGLADSCDHKSMSREPTEEEEMKKYIKQIVDKRLADSCDDRSKSREPTEEEKGKKYKKQIEDKGLAHDYKSWRIKRAETRQQYKQHTLDLGLANSSMKLLESYFESAPQLCLQLYILFKHFSQRSSLGVTRSTVPILSSWLSLALSSITLYKFKRMYKSSGGKMSKSAQLVKFLWRAFETGGRVLCMTLFASTFEYLIVAILVPHVLLVAFWDIKRNLENPEDRTLENSSMNSNGSINWKTVAFAVLLGYVSLFYFPNSFGPPHTKTDMPRPSLQVFVGFYLVFYVENIFMLILWAWLTPGIDVWFIRLGIQTVLFFFILHIVTQVFYYKFTHPNCDDIKVCV